MIGVPTNNHNGTNDSHHTHVRPTTPPPVRLFQEGGREEPTCPGAPRKPRRRPRQQRQEHYLQRPQPRDSSRIDCNDDKNNVHRSSGEQNKDSIKRNHNRKTNDFNQLQLQQQQQQQQAQRKKKREHEPFHRWSPLSRYQDDDDDEANQCWTPTTTSMPSPRVLFPSDDTT